MSRLTGKMVSLRTAAGMVVAATGVFFAGVYAARATPGVSGGPARTNLSFAGTLRGTTGPQTLTFTFEKAGTAVCTVPVPNVTPDPATGAFNADIDITMCPATLFDGADVVFDVSVGGTPVAMDQPVNPVPYARYADHVGTADCPVGYARDTAVTTAIVCAKGSDQMVRVGTGATAFWIDRYEASMWQMPDGSGTQYGIGTMDDYPMEFPDNGQWTTAVYAASRRGVAPSRFMTWFQANEACRASGKRLPTNSEWQSAALGTPDPGQIIPLNMECNTGGGAPRNSGGGPTCVSRWGAEDMIGNVWEWVSEWHAGVGDTSQTSGWPSTFVAGMGGSDTTMNVIGTVRHESEMTNYGGIPAAVARGGDATMLSNAGLFAFSLRHSPSSHDGMVGFRCVIPR